MANYKLVDSSNADHWDVEITSGEYRGLVVRYYDVAFKEENDQGICSFNYDVISNPDGIGTHNNNLVNELGDTLMTLISDSLAHQAVKKEMNS